jgi:hypothetical protein
MALDGLEAFIVAAKAATYVGNGEKAEPSRPCAHDLVFSIGPWRYRDSYFGGADFLGQETVWHDGEPVWSMLYYGYITRPDLIDGMRAAATIKAALAALYAEGRFLGGWDWDGPHGRYADTSTGTHEHFHGRETITVGGIEAYALDYFGGLVKP